MRSAPAPTTPPADTSSARSQIPINVRRHPARRLPTTTPHGTVSCRRRSGCRSRSARCGGRQRLHPRPRHRRSSCVCVARRCTTAVVRLETATLDDLNLAMRRRIPPVPSRLRPIVASRRQLHVADGTELVETGFPLLPTLDAPQWTVMVATPTADQFHRVRKLFRGPVDNPAFVRSSR